MEHIKSRLLKLRNDELLRINPYPLSLVVSEDKGTGEQTYNVRETTPFQPYSDPFLDMSYDPYSEDNKGETDDYLIESLVNKIITNQAVSLAEGKEYFEDYENTFYDKGKVPEMYRIRSNSGFYPHDRALPKKTQMNEKRGRKKKSKADESQLHMSAAYGELPVGGEQFVRADGTQMITLTVNMIRQYMYSEVQVRVRHVTDYYKRQWDLVNRERMQSLADLIKSQETTRRLKLDICEMNAALVGYKMLCSELGNQLSNTKEAKKRRRQAKRQRKSETTVGGNDDNLVDENEAGVAPACRDVIGEVGTADTNNNGDVKPNKK